jgi:hypothetical protein
VISTARKETDRARQEARVKEHEKHREEMSYIYANSTPCPRRDRRGRVFVLHLMNDLEEEEEFKKQEGGVP